MKHGFLTDFMPHAAHVFLYTRGWRYNI